MLIRVYIAPQIGTGTMDDPFRSLLNDFIDVSAGEWFDEIDNPVGRRSLCTVTASQATHDAIYNDRKANSGRIVYLTPLAATHDEKKLFFGSKVKDVPPSFKQVAKDELSKHMDTSAINDEVTVKDITKALIHKFFDGQRLAAGLQTEDWSKYKIKFAGEDF